jgi:hypothetical protein
VSSATFAKTLQLIGRLGAVDPEELMGFTPPPPVK